MAGRALELEGLRPCRPARGRRGRRRGSPTRSRRPCGRSASCRRPGAPRVEDHRRTSVDRATGRPASAPCRPGTEVTRRIELARDVDEGHAGGGADLVFDWSILQFPRYGFACRWFRRRPRCRLAFGSAWRRPAARRAGRGSRPSSPVADEPGRRLAERLRFQVAEPSGPGVGARSARLLQHLQVPRDRRLRHRERTSELADGQVAAVGEPGEDRPTGGSARAPKTVLS